MNIYHFDDLLLAARNQPLPQRLLFVFTTSELPDDCSAEQRADFEAGDGGALVPIMCVDLSPLDIDNFAQLKQKAAEFKLLWMMVFAAALSGAVGEPPSTEDAREALDAMVQAIKLGDLNRFIPFNADGDTVALQGPDRFLS
jgi:hypothetical protein